MGSFVLNTSLCNPQSHPLAVYYNMCHSFPTNIQLGSHPSFAIAFSNQKVICRDGKDLFYPSLVNVDLFPRVYFLALCLFNLDYYRFFKIKIKPNYMNSLDYIIWELYDQ